MGWCGLNRVAYLFDLAKNERLVAAIATELQQAQQLSRRTGRPQPNPSSANRARRERRHPDASHTAQSQAATR